MPRFALSSFENWITMNVYIDIQFTYYMTFYIQLEKEIEDIEAKFTEVIQRRERENEESRNLEMMLRSDLERINSER